MRFVVAALAASALLAGCSSSSAPPKPPVAVETEPGPDGIISLAGDDTLHYSTEVMRAPAGEVKIQMTCGGAVEHDIVIEGENDEEPVAGCGRGTTGQVGSIELSAGTYNYYCSIPGHNITMTGELVVS